MFKTFLFRRDFANKLRKLNKIEAINKGGCAIVAYALAEYIAQKYPKKKPEIVFMFKNDYLSGLDNVANGIPDSCNHAVVKIDDYYYDSNGKYTLQDLKEQGYISILSISKEFTIKALQIGRWNRCFDRAKNVPIIAKALKVQLPYE